MGAYNMQNDESIPNLASEFKSDNIWPLFLAQKKTMNMG